MIWDNEFLFVQASNVINNFVWYFNEIVLCIRVCMCNP